MDLKFKECAHAGTNLFEDIVKYKTVDKYLQAIFDIFAHKIDKSYDEPHFIPLDCAVKDPKTDKWRWIVQFGQPCADGQKNVNWVKRQPAFVRHIVSDYIVIRADDVERELFFGWQI